MCKMHSSKNIWSNFLKFWKYKTIFSLSATPSWHSSVFVSVTFTGERVIHCADSTFTQRPAHVCVFTLIRELITMAPAFTIGLWGLSAGEDDKTRFSVDEEFGGKWEFSLHESSPLGFSATSTYDTRQHRVGYELNTEELMNHEGTWCVLCYTPSSSSDSMLNLSPLGSMPTYWWTLSVPPWWTAMAYCSGFTQDCRQNGCLVSPTECLEDNE